MGIHGHGTGARYETGITLLEMMVTLGIAAILLLTGVPALQQFNMKQRMKAAVAGLHNDLVMARSEAVYRNAVVVACPGSPEDGCSGGSDWSQGWIVFDDANGDRQRQDAEDMVRHGQAREQIAILAPASRTELRFFPDGSAPGSNVSISLCGLDGPPGARKLVISNIGRIRRDRFASLDPGRCPG